MASQRLHNNSSTDSPAGIRLIMLHCQLTHDMDCRRAMFALAIAVPMAFGASAGPSGVLVWAVVDPIVSVGFSMGP